MRLPRPAAFAALLSTIAPIAAHADSASAWSKSPHSALRLIAGAPRSGFSRAGIELVLSPGWKTYWRYPGDSGVPPRFDFGHSENLKSVEILWPAPRRYPDGAGGVSIGYEGRLVLPFRVLPRQPGVPIHLHLTIDYAICEKLCVPANAQLDLVLDEHSADPALDQQLAMSEARVPQPATVGGAGELAVAAAQRAGARLTLSVRALTGEAVDAFLEGPTAEWALPLPELSDTTQDGGGATHRFVTELPPGVAENAASGVVLRATVVSGARAIEVPIHLD